MIEIFKILGYIFLCVFFSISLFSMLCIMFNTPISFKSKYFELEVKSNLYDD